MSELSEELGKFFHRVVELLPWRAESEKNEAHASVDEHVVPTLVGRNATPAGVVKPDDEKKSDEGAQPDDGPDKGKTTAAKKTSGS